MKILKKAGWLILTALPAALCYAMQYACGYAVLYYYYFKLKAERPDEPSGFLKLLASVQYSGNAIYGVVLYHVIAVVVFGLFYYFVWGKKKRPEGTEKPKWHRIPVIIVMGGLLQIAISGALNLIYVWKPEWLREYLQMMQTIGLGDMTFLVILASVILAPIGEELLCRGIMLKLAEKVTNRFWLANILQALAFGVIHGNLVQGSYAFILGLVFGYVYGKYRNIWICMLLHAVINFSSNYVDWIFYALYNLPKNALVAGMTGIVLVSVLLLAGCFWSLGKIRKPQQTSVE